MYMYKCVHVHVILLILILNMLKDTWLPNHHENIVVVVVYTIGYFDTCESKGQSVINRMKALTTSGKQIHDELTMKSDEVIIKQLINVSLIKN